MKSCGSCMQCWSQRCCVCDAYNYHLVISCTQSPRVIEIMHFGGEEVGVFLKSAEDKLSFLQDQKNADQPVDSLTDDS